MDRIAKASDDVVRNTLMILCQDPFVQIKALAAMDQLERHMHSEREKRAAAGSPAPPTTRNGNGNSNSHGNGNGTGTGSTACAPASSGMTKRKAVQEVYACVHCRARFTETTNASDACQYHPGTFRRKKKHQKKKNPIHTWGGGERDVEVLLKCLLFNIGELVEGDRFFEDTFSGDAELSVEEMFEEDPERVDWDCCGENGLHAGCTTDWHRSHHPTQRARTGEWGR